MSSFLLRPVRLVLHDCLVRSFIILVLVPVLGCFDPWCKVSGDSFVKLLRRVWHNLTVDSRMKCVPIAVNGLIAVFLAVKPLSNVGLILGEFEIERLVLAFDRVQQEGASIFEIGAFDVFSEVDGRRHSMDHPDASLDDAILHFR